MGRRAAIGVVVAACLLAFAGTAWAGWKSFANSGIQNIVEPSSLRTKAGSELIAWNTANALYVLRNGTLETVLSGVPYVGKPALVQQPDGTLQLYVPAQNLSSTLDGVVRLSSSDDGATWAAPVQTSSHDIADVGSAAVAPDGTPYFTQSGTGFVDVYSGLNGDSVQNVFTDCCGYAESVAIDSLGVARVAFWSNGSSEPNRFVLDQLGGAVTTYGSQTAPRNDRVPLVSYGAHTYLLWADGYPDATALYLRRFPGGQVKLDRGGFTGGDPHMALALEPDGKLWALWTKGGVVKAARSRTSGKNFGATVSVSDPKGSTAYQLEAFARPGSVEALLNTGSTLWEAKLLPGLTIHAGRKAASVVDDGFPVKGARLKAGHRTIYTTAHGIASLAKLKPGTRVSVTKAGYTPASFRVP